jgi:hypothetical protein
LVYASHGYDKANGHVHFCTKYSIILIISTYKELSRKWIDRQFFQIWMIKIHIELCTEYNYKIHLADVNPYPVLGLGS